MAAGSCVRSRSSRRRSDRAAAAGDDSARFRRIVTASRAPSTFPGAFAPDLARCSARAAAAAAPSSLVMRTVGEAMPPPARIADIFARSPEHEGRRFAVGRAERRHRREARGIARVGSRRDRDHAPRASRDGRQRGVPVGGGRGGVRLVHDEKIPDVRVERRGDVARASGNPPSRGRRPGAAHGLTSAGRSATLRRSHAASTAIGWMSNQADSSPHHCRRRPAGTATRIRADVLARQEIGDDPAGLDRLAESDFVGEEHARGATGHRDRGRELIGEDRMAPRCAARHARRQRIHGAGDRGTDGRRPRPQSDRSQRADSGPPRSVDRTARAAPGRLRQGFAELRAKAPAGKSPRRRRWSSRQSACATTASSRQRDPRTDTAAPVSRQVAAAAPPPERRHRRFRDPLSNSLAFERAHDRRGSGQGQSACRRSFLRCRARSTG